MSARVLHLLAPAPFGGLERVVHLLATGQRARGDDVGVALLLEEGVPEPPLAAGLERAGVPVTRLVARPRRYGAQQALVRDAIRATAPQVLHTHGYVADVMGALARRRSPVRHVSTVHGFTGGDRRNRLYEWLQCRSLRGAHAMIAVSAALAADLARRGIPPARVHAVRNAWRATDRVNDDRARAAARATLGVRDGEVVLMGWVGRVTHEKGLDVLVDALPALAGLPWHLVVVGDGRERAGLEARVATLGLSAHVTWLGTVPRVDAVMPAFDVLVLSSRTEGTPMVLFEAMDAGVPVIATAVGGVPDVVCADEAILVAPASPPALANAVRLFAGDRPAASARARRARTRLLREFGVDSWLASHDRVYHGADSGGAPHRP